MQNEMPGKRSSAIARNRNDAHEKKPLVNRKLTRRRKQMKRSVHDKNQINVPEKQPEPRNNPTSAPAMPPHNEERPTPKKTRASNNSNNAISRKPNSAPERTPRKPRLNPRKVPVTL